MDHSQQSRDKLRANRTPVVPPDQLKIEEMNKDFNDKCDWLRQILKEMNGHLTGFIMHPCFALSNSSLPPDCLPASRNNNAKINLAFAYRHIEDARMRVGKALQAMQGGVSILDKIDTEADAIGTDHAGSLAPADASPTLDELNAEADPTT